MYDASTYTYDGLSPHVFIDKILAPKSHKFTGKERDSESGLDNFPARYLTSSLGRWMSPDPAGKRAARLNDPQTWNMYAYVRNNPTTLTHPSRLIVQCSSDLGKKTATPF